MSGIWWSASRGDLRSGLRAGSGDPRPTGGLRAGSGDPRPTVDLGADRAVGVGIAGRKRWIEGRGRNRGAAHVGDLVVGESGRPPVRPEGGVGRPAPNR